MMGRKLGFSNPSVEDAPLIHSLLNIMQTGRYDYTNTFIYLRSLLKALNFDPGLLLAPSQSGSMEFKHWCKEWRTALEQKQQSVKDTVKIMEAANPMVIPRNHLVENAIQEAEKGNLSTVKILLKILAKPYDYSFSSIKYILPSGDDQPYITYCGT